VNNTTECNLHNNIYHRRKYFPIDYRKPLNTEHRLHTVLKWRQDGGNCSTETIRKSNAGVDRRNQNYRDIVDM